MIPDRKGPTVDTTIIASSSGAISVARPNTGLDDDTHELISTPVLFQVRNCRKDIDTGGRDVYKAPITKALVAQLWCDTYLVRWGGLDILPRAVNRTEYQFITGDYSGYMGSWLCGVNFCNALTDLTMGSQNRAYTTRTELDCYFTFGYWPAWENNLIKEFGYINKWGYYWSVPQELNILYANGNTRGYRMPLYEEANALSIGNEWLGYTETLLATQVGHRCSSDWGVIGRYRSAQTVASQTILRSINVDTYKYNAQTDNQADAYPFANGETYKIVGGYTEDNNAYPYAFRGSTLVIERNQTTCNRWYNARWRPRGPWHDVHDGYVSIPFRVCRPAQ